MHATKIVLSTVYSESAKQSFQAVFTAHPTREQLCHAIEAEIATLDGRRNSFGMGIYRDQIAGLRKTLDVVRLHTALDKGAGIGKQDVEVAGIKVGYIELDWQTLHDNTRPAVVDDSVPAAYFVPAGTH